MYTMLCTCIGVYGLWLQLNNYIPLPCIIIAGPCFALGNMTGLCVIITEKLCYPTYNDVCNNY